MSTSNGQDNSNKKERSSFSGRLGFVLSAAGASVGLGNIWRFPYLAAKYGGGIFLLVYIILALTFGYSMIMAETAIGRMTKKSPVGAFGFFGHRFTLKLGGWINAVVPMLIVPYYSTIGGWVVKYMVGYFTGPWPRTDTFLISSATACRQSSFSWSLPARSWSSSIWASATVLSGFPNS